MPIIYEFLGIIIVIYFDDHASPHIHVKYQEYRASVLIKTGEIESGKLPPRVLKLVRKWLLNNRDAVLEQWDRMEKGEEVQRTPIQK